MDELSAIDPVRGYKRAWLTPTKNGLRFRGVSYGVYGVEEEAACKKNPCFLGITMPKPKNHDLAPTMGCQCGFYAWKDPYATRNHYCGSFSSLVLEVDLYGRIIECERGYRAQYQRVLAVTVGDRCMWCTRQPRFTCTVKVDKNLRMVCGECGNSKGRLLTPLTELANVLGTEVRLPFPRTSPTPTLDRPTGLVVPAP